MGQEQSKGEFSLLICFYMLNYMLIIENQCIPIHPITRRCPLQCCSQTYVPLLLAHSCTIRDLSTMTLPTNTTVVCDIGETHCEQSSPGLLYTCVGKSTNLYNTTTPSSTTVYFTSLPHSLQYRTQMESMKKITTTMVPVLATKPIINHVNNYSTKKQSTVSYTMVNITIDNTISILYTTIC